MQNICTIKNKWKSIYKFTNPFTNDIINPIERFYFTDHIKNVLTIFLMWFIGEKGGFTMLLSTYQKVIALFESGNGYRNASELKDAKITTVQIKELVNKGIVEHVSHGFYWLIDEEKGKPENYQFIEACMVNPRAVICADSACYFHGLIDKMPETLSVATLKTDRSRMQLNFPVCRHYYSNLAFEQDMDTVETPYGQIRVYGVERSVCDCIRFRDDIGQEMLDLVISNFLERNGNQMDRLLAYADAMRVGKIVRIKLNQIEE